MTMTAPFRYTLTALLGATLLCLGGCTDEPDAGSARLNADTLAGWQSYLEPDSDELAFQRIPWLPTYVEGVHRADTERRPLLLWIMNGHPLGCT
jgi:hypothetical protein